MKLIVNTGLCVVWYVYSVSVITAFNRVRDVCHSILTAVVVVVVLAVVVLVVGCGG